MIMRVTWGKIRPGHWEQYEELWNANLHDTANVTGLKGRLLLRDTENKDAGYSMSLWENTVDYESYSQSMTPNPKMVECFVGQYVTTICEVHGTDFRFS